MLKSVGLRSGGLLAISISGTGLAFVSQVLVARLLGVEAYGYFAYVMALIGILVFFSQAGFDYLLMRFIPAIKEGEQNETGNDLPIMLVTGFVAAFVVGGVLSIGTCVFYVWLQYDTWSPLFFDTLYIGLLMVPVLALVYLMQASLIGVHKQIQAKLLTEVARPVVFLILVGGIFVSGVNSSAPNLMAINLLVTAFLLIAAFAVLKQFLPIDVRQGLIFDSVRLRKWFSIALPLLIFSIPTALILQIDTLMLGTILGPEHSGTYWAVAKVASFVAFPLYAANTVVAPMIAGAYAKGEKFDAIMRASTVASLALCIIAILSLVFIGEWLLGLFGPQFRAFMPSLLILCAGYGLATALGPVDYALTMTGHEKFSAFATGAGLVLCIVLNSLLIPQYEAMGAALSTAVSLVAIRVVLMLGVWRFHGILYLFSVGQATAKKVE